MEESIDEILKGLDLSSEQGVPESKRNSKAWLTIYVDLEDKRKFDLLQEKTNKQFGKKLKQIFKLSLNKCSL
jgi:hypothetical protein